MKRTLLLLAASAAIASTFAVPAVPTPMQANQPDGTTLTVRICGDEFYNFITTDDGYTIMRDSEGYYAYAQRTANGLEPSVFRAHNEAERNLAEKGFLATITPRLTDRAAVQQSKKARAKMQAPANKAQIDFSKFRGLVILVNYSDVKFTRSDANEFYSKMLNTTGYTGFTNEDGSTNPYGAFTGSVRDYFYDNSNGLFSPQFDVVGPFDVNYTAAQGKNSSRSIFTEAINKADAQVNFNNYDVDSDGYVDLVFFIVAGSGSNSDEDNPNNLWPHRSMLYKRVDQVYTFDYACSTEYLYNPIYGLLDGIGTICHEFSHVLGLPDLYDTDYKENGQSQTPGDWDVMSGGSYLNYGRTPVAYSIYDRYAAGFNNPTIIKETGTYTLNQVGATGEGFILKTPVNKEIFLIENRQKTRWDAYAPGHGMLIAHMDSTYTSLWTNNDVNSYSNNNCYTLLRAGNSTTDEAPSDPFPGTNGVISVNNNTTPNLLTKTGKKNSFGLYEITENDGVITFKVKTDDQVHTAVETFEPMDVTTVKNLQNVQGSLTTWNFNKSNVVAPGEGNCNGEKAVALLKASSLVMAQDVGYDAYLVTFQLVNSASVAAKFTCGYSTDGGTTWTNATSTSGASNVEVAANSSVQASFNVDINVPARYRVVCTAGSTSKATYIDDFTIHHEGEIDIPDPTVYGDVNGDGQVTAADVSAVYNIILGASTDYADNADVNGDGQVTAADVSIIYNIILGAS